jgi:hypothetical protein
VVKRGLYRLYMLRGNRAETDAPSVLTTRGCRTRPTACLHKRALDAGQEDVEESANEPSCDLGQISSPDELVPQPEQRENKLGVPGISLQLPP